MSDKRIRDNTMNIQAYRDLCLKNDEENYFFDKYFFRKISIFFSILFIKLKVSANTATFISLLSCIAACVLIIINTPLTLVLAAIAIILYYILDHVDGELARYYIRKKIRKPSVNGQYFDQLVHKYSTNLFLFFFGLTIFDQYGYRIFLYIGFIACMALSGFPGIMASKVFIQTIANKTDILKDPAVMMVMKRLEQKKETVTVMNQKMNMTKLKKIMGEALVFPGGVLLCVTALVLDAFFFQLQYREYHYNFRMILLVLLTPVYLLKTIIDWIDWMKHFRSVA